MTKERKNKRQGFPLKLRTLIPFLFYFILFYFIFFKSQFKLKRLRCKDSLRSAFCAHVFKGKKRERTKEI